MDNKEENINPFTGMENSKCIALQRTWEKTLAGEYGVNFFNFDELDHKIKKSYLLPPDAKISEFEISYEQMCPSSINFQYDIKI